MSEVSRDWLRSVNISDVMPVNIEIKARFQDFARVTSRLSSFAGTKQVKLDQEDTFFDVPTGKLKMRCDKEGRCELIYYRREALNGIMTSCYFRQPVDKPHQKRAQLEQEYGIRTVVRKQRTAFIAGDVRIHLDEVESLGKFLEIEVLANNASERKGARQLAKKMMRLLGVDDSDLVVDAYEDLLYESRHR